jgi:hypothetical protein
MPNVTVNPPNTIKVRVNSQQQGTVKTIGYGLRTLKGADDLSLVGAEDGDVITYDAPTNSFSVTPVEAIAITKVDAGKF